MSDRHLQLFDPEIESILDGDRAIPEPPAGARDRVRSRVLLSLGLGAAGVAGASSAAAATTSAPAPTPAAPPPSLAPTSGFVRGATFRLAVTCLAGALVGGGVIYLVMRERMAPVVSSVAPAPADKPRLVDPPAAVPTLAQPVDAPAPGVALDEPPPPATTAPVVEAPTPSKSTRPHRTRTAPHVRIAGPDGAADDATREPSGLEAERRLLEQARAALAVGDARRALASLDQHGARFPRGQLGEERESLRVRVLVAAGRDNEARALGVAFRRRFPGSVYLPAVDATLQNIP